MTADPIERLLRIDAQSSLPGLPDGPQAAFAYTPDHWREQGLKIARELAATGQRFTVVDLKRRGLPEPPHYNQWGGLFAAIGHRRIAEVTGWTSHERRGVERPIRIWQALESNGDPK